MLRWIASGLMLALVSCSGIEQDPTESPVIEKEPPKCSYTIFNLNGHWGFDTYIGDSMAKHVTCYVEGSDTTYLNSFQQADSCANAYCEGIELPDV